MVCLEIKKKYYSEYDPVVLKTNYAKTKYDGEKIALSNCRNTVIVRPGWMYGGSIHHKKNFVVARIKEVKSIESVKSAIDKYGNPTWSKDAAIALIELIKNNDIRGVFNLSNSGGTSRAGYIEAIIKFAKLNVKVMGVDSSHFKRVSNVPDCEMLNNDYLNSKINYQMRNWEEALKNYVGSLDINSF